MAASKQGLPYLLFEPCSSPEPRPGLLFLHGRGERGDSLETLGRLLVHSLPFLAATGRLPAEVADDPFPFAIACPQTCHGRWQADASRVLDLVDELYDSRRLDPRRCYLTGISMGGGGCWDLAATDPGRFAAIVPVSARVRVEDQISTQPPAWVMQGEKERISAEETRKILDGARAADSETHLTVLRDAAHNGEYWNRVYADPALYAWLLAHSL
jgi:predicted peptidase